MSSSSSKLPVMVAWSQMIWHKSTTSTQISLWARRPRIAVKVPSWKFLCDKIKTKRIFNLPVEFRIPGQIWPGESPERSLLGWVCRLSERWVSQSQDWETSWGLLAPSYFVVLPASSYSAFAWCEWARSLYTARLCDWLGDRVNFSRPPEHSSSQELR